MSPGLKGWLKKLFYIEPEERLKVLYLAASFLLVIGGYTIAKELKDSVFVSVVGREHQPTAKLWAIFMLIPAILVYSRLVDVLRRYQLLYLYSVLYGALGIVFAYYLGHPQIGILNTDTGTHRLFGWLFYFFVEGYSPFVVSVFWAFANSISSPEAAKRNYSFVVVGSKIGGMLSSAFAWFLLSHVDVPGGFNISSVAAHQLLLLVSAATLLIVPFVVTLLMRRVPGKYLHGYEAVYQVEKKKGEQEVVKSENIIKRIFVTLYEMFSGLILFARNPYVLGIFGTLFFYEVINVVFQYQRLTVAAMSAANIAGLSTYLYGQVFFVHLVGLLFCLFGTRTLLTRLGVRMSLILVPVLTGGLMLYLMTSYNPTAIFLVFVGLRAMNYAFASPLREILYIPTIKEVKFKSKSWIDAFGSKLAKGSGASANLLLSRLGAGWFFPAHIALFTGIVFAWLINAIFLGRRYHAAVENNEVIGLYGENRKLSL